MSYIGNSPTQGAITGGNIVDGSIESIDLATLTNIDINSGSIDGTVIGASVASTGEFTEVSLGDNDKIKLGASDDLQIYHDGSNSYVKDSGTGNLYVDGANVAIRNAGGTSTSLFYNSGLDQTYLYAGGSVKLNTTSTGVDVTGTVTADGLTVDTNTLHVDATNNRVGVNTASPSHALHINTPDTSGRQNLDAIDRTSSNLIKVTNPQYATNASAGMIFKVFPDSDARQGAGIIASGGSGNNVTDLALFTTDSVDVTYANYRVDGATGVQTFYTAPNTERMRLDSSGNLLVGTSTSPVGSGGLSVRNRFTVGYQGALNGYGAENYSGLFYSGDNNAGYTAINSNSTNGCLYLSRTASAPNGIMMHFASNGSGVGLIGVYSNDQLYMSRGDQGVKFKNNALIPCDGSGNDDDNDQDLGIATARWDDIYATNGTIQTSDRNEKQDIEVLNDAEQRVAQACKGLLRKFRWKDSVSEKGDEARIHFGIIAQDLRDAFTAEGLDAGRYAMFISTTWTDEETGEERTRLGVRYNQLLAFIISAI